MSALTQKKRELVNCVDMDKPKDASPVRYTQPHRRNEEGFAVYKKADEDFKSQAVVDAEASLEGFNSRSVDLASFRVHTLHRNVRLHIRYPTDM